MFSITSLSIIRYVPVLTPSLQVGGFDMDSTLLCRRHLIVAVSAALLFVAAWAQALSLPISAALILGGSLGIIYWDRKNAEQSANQGAAMIVHTGLQNPAERVITYFRRALYRVHHHRQAAEMLIAKCSSQVKDSRECSEVVLTCNAEIEIFINLLRAGFRLTPECFQEALNLTDRQPKYFEAILSIKSDSLKDCFTVQEQASFFMNVCQNKNALKFFSKCHFDLRDVGF